MSLRTKYRLLKELVILMGLADYCLLFGGGYLAGMGSVYSLMAFIALAVNYYLSSKLGYVVLEMLVRLQNGEA
jgi:membrane protein DedA with SNARE-associated domain